MTSSVTSICCQTRKCSVLIAVTNNTPSISVSLWELRFHFCTKKAFAIVIRGGGHYRDYTIIGYMARPSLERTHCNIAGRKWPFRGAVVSAAAPASTKDASQWETAAVRARHVPDDLTATRRAGVLRRLLTRRDLINQPC